MARFGLLEKIIIPTYHDTNQVTPGHVEFDHEKCVGCAICVEACPADSIALKDKKPTLKPPGENECIACGDCVAICPEGAIRLVRGYRYTKYFKTIDQGTPIAPRLFGND